MTKILLTVVHTALVIAYPLTVYLGLTHFGARQLGIVLLLLLLPGILARAHSAPRADLWVVVRVPLTLILVLGVGAALDDPRLFLALPVVANLALLAHFAGSLRGEVSLVERFARLQEPELPPGGPAYCRRVTQVWCVFFVVNAAIAGALALWAPLGVWTLYTGLLAYLLMGLLFTVEFVVRKLTFRRFGDSLPDRLLARILRPARAP
ncbi:MAG: hypothetical protein R3B09_23425 [Nannocystaceae bacterium]